MSRFATLANVACAIGAVALAATACRFGGEPVVPVRGELPRVVAVWPRVASDDGDGAHCLFGLDAALRARGYQVVPAGVAAELLAADAGAASVSPSSAGTLLGCDAVLELVVGEFTPHRERLLRDAQWDLQWRLVSARGGGVMWSRTLRGRWVAPIRDPGDPHRPVNPDPEIVPIGGPPRGSYRDEQELLADLHRAALAVLPEAPARGGSR